MMKSAPSINLINLDDHDEPVTQALELALTETGFVMIQGHGISETLIAKMRSVLDATLLVRWKPKCRNA